MLVTPGSRPGTGTPGTCLRARAPRAPGEQILAVVEHLAAGHLVAVAAGQHLRQRALAGAVRPHDRVHLARLHREVDAACRISACPSTPRVQIPDFQHA